MLRLLIAAAVFAFLTKVVPLAAAVYTGPTSLAGGAAGVAHPAGTLFPGVAFGDPTDHFSESGDLSALLSRVNELFGSPRSAERPQTVASLYGEGGNRQNPAAEDGADATIPVVVGADGNQPPIRVFTGADTNRILTQLFADILDVNEETFARRRNGRTPPASIRPAPGGARLSIGGSGLADGNFLATQTLSAEPGWIDQPPIRSTFDPALPPIEEKPATKNTEVLTFILSMLNPYFYGALLLLLVFSVAWSMRSRLSHDGDRE